ncbi:MAG TPA: DUF1501 domain-containing protein [Gemmataceae bacterium]|jgi:uncharacterized protein (DUF1501 family)|nr:DUF1501 domain-containing protein [Gemmataceae bacterium]
MFSRREFLRTGLQASTLVALAPTVPGFLAQTARAARPEKDGRVLVVIQLDGGNDGINTVVPFADAGYAKHRTALRLPADRLLKINKEVGLHPAMGDAAKLLETGRLAVVQGVSYPNPSRSHFKSMAIWHSANVGLPKADSDDVETRASFGWIGQALDGGRRPRDGAPDALFMGTGALPAALRSQRAVASAMTRPEDSVLTLKANARSAVAGAVHGRDLAAFVQRSTLDAYATSERMAEVLRGKDGGARYPATALAERLRTVARLLKGGVGTRVFYTSQGSYDTHYIQAPQHAELLSELSGALRAFLDDLAAAGLAERVTVLAFSEFGRRVQENGSQGTDHGTAAPVFLAGPAVHAGLVGLTPRLLDLQDGDLKMTVDFRQVYAAVLEKWLRLPSRPALGGAFEPLPLFRT